MNANVRRRTAVVAISPRGVLLGTRLQGALDADLWVAARYADCALADAHLIASPLREYVGEFFRCYEHLIFLLPLGAVVRLIAPHLRDKRSDPAVVVVDDGAAYAISLLSGHLGGANELARRTAQILGARPVITTAAEVHQTLAVDLLGRAFGWQIADDRDVTAVSAAVINGDPVALYQDAGEVWLREEPLPATIQWVSDLSQCGSFAAALVITDRQEIPPGTCSRMVVYRPRSLVVGVGCNRNTSAEEILAAVATTLSAHGLAPEAVRGWASIDAKADEAGLLAAAASGSHSLHFFSKEELNAVQVPNPSAAPMRYVGAQGVAEPAALVGAGEQGELIVPKQKMGNCTVAVARIRFDRR